MRLHQNILDNKEDLFAHKCTKAISHKRQKNLGMLSPYAIPFYLPTGITVKVTANIQTESTTQSTNLMTSKENKHDT